LEGRTKAQDRSALQDELGTGGARRYRDARIPRTQAAHALVDDLGDVRRFAGGVERDYKGQTVAVLRLNRERDGCGPIVDEEICKRHETRWSRFSARGR
jgi:hypothetical protein